MPLDGHSYLVSQGWGGKGTALREGAISRPITVAQKKNLAGLGKDRDEAFPFWDHLFSAAAKSIQIKYTSDDEDASDSSTTAEVTLKRTSTGILSTRRPIEGTPAASGSSTPSTDAQPSADSRISLVAHAKREAAKRGLYSRFFRGPILGPEAIEAEEQRLVALVSESFDKQNESPSSHVEKMTITEHIEVETEDHEHMVVDLEVSKSVKHKKRRDRKEKAVDSEESEDEDERQARKKMRKEEKRRKADGECAEADKREKKRKSKSKAKDEVDTAAKPLDVDSPADDAANAGEDNATTSRAKKDKKRKSKSRLEDSATTADSTTPVEASKASLPAVDEDEVAESKEDRARRKEEKRRLKALRNSEAVSGSATSESRATTAGETHSSKSSKRHEKSSPTLEAGDHAAKISDEPTKKKKRKRSQE